MIMCPQCGEVYEAKSLSCPNCAFSPCHDEGFLEWAPELATDSEGFRPEYFQQLAQLEAQNFWFTSRNKLIIWAISCYFPHIRSFLEVGCGTGFVLSGIAAAFPKVQLFGTEIYLEGLRVARIRLNAHVQLMQMDARIVPYKEEFDLIGAFDVLEHIKEDDQVLASLYRACKPGGGVLLTVPQHQWLWSVADEKACHQRRYHSDILNQKLSDAGFEVIRTTSFVSLLLPLMMVSRLKRRGIADTDPSEELRIHPILNRLLENILTIERWLIRLGLNWPLGGSRLVLARRAG